MDARAFFPVGPKSLKRSRNFKNKSGANKRKEIKPIRKFLKRKTFYRNFNQMNNKEGIIIYQTSDKKVKIDVNLDQDTVWLTQKQMASLFSKGVPTINEHIKNIFKERELSKNQTIRKFRIVQKDRNNYLYKDSGEKKINDNALVVLALLIAVSDRQEKDKMIKLVTNLLK